MQRYEILKNGTVDNVIIADEVFVTGHYPGAWRLAADQGMPAATPPEWEWYIDLGPMSDRFGVASAAIDLSTEPGVVAVRSDFARRKWIDLKEPRVIAAINYLAGKAHPVLGTLATPLISAAVAAAALGTKPGLTENLALRKLYFSA